MIVVVVCGVHLARFRTCGLYSSAYYTFVVTEIQSSYHKDPASLQLLAELAVTSTKGCYTQQDGLIRYKNRIWVGAKRVIQHKIFSSLHSTAIGGHSGSEVTYKRIKHLFAWPFLKQTVKDLVTQCQTC